MKTKNKIKNSESGPLSIKKLKSFIKEYESEIECHKSEIKRMEKFIEYYRHEIQEMGPSMDTKSKRAVNSIHPVRWFFKGNK